MTHLFDTLVSAYRAYNNRKAAADYISRVPDWVLVDIGVARGDVFK